MNETQKEKLNQIFDKNFHVNSNFFDILFFNLESKMSIELSYGRFLSEVFSSNVFENIGKKINMYKIENQVNIYYASYQEYLKIHQFLENKIIGIYEHNIDSLQKKAKQFDYVLNSEKNIRQNIQKYLFFSCIENTQYATIAKNHYLIKSELHKLKFNEQCSIDEFFSSIFKILSKTGQDKKDIQKSIHEWHKILQENQFYSSPLFMKNFDEYTKKMNDKINRSLIDDLISKKIFIDNLFVLSILTKTLNMIEKNIHYTTSTLLTNIFDSSIEMIEGKNKMNDDLFFKTEVGQFMNQFLDSTYRKKDLHNLSMFKMNSFKWLKSQLIQFNVDLSEIIIENIPIEKLIKKTTIKAKNDFIKRYQVIHQEMEDLKKEMNDERAYQQKEFDNQKSKNNSKTSLIELIYVDEKSFNFQAPDALVLKKEKVESKFNQLYQDVIEDLEQSEIYKNFTQLPKKTIQDFVYIQNYMYYVESGVSATKNSISIETVAQKYKLSIQDTKLLQEITLEFLYEISKENRQYFYDLIERKITKYLNKTKNPLTEQYWLSLKIFLENFKDVFSQDKEKKWTLQEFELLTEIKGKKIKKI